jgi:hypothetical protein
LRRTLLRAGVRSALGVVASLSDLLVVVDNGERGDGVKDAF